MLIKCSECGMEISDKAKTCPHCGCPVEQQYHVPEIEIQKKEDLGQRYRNKVEDKGNNATYSKLSIISLILSILGCTYIFGLICAIVDLRRKDAYKHTLSWVAVGISIFWMLSLAAMYSNNGEKSDEISMNQDNKIESEVEESSTIEEDAASVDDLFVAQNEETTNIFATDLMNEWEDYVGKWVTVSYPCGRTDDDNKTIQSEYDSNSGHYLRSYVDNYMDFEYGDYVTVTGIVEKEYASYIEIKNAHVDSYGDDSENDYAEKKSAWNEKQHELAVQERDLFIEKSEMVSYDDLRRYPDTYKDKEITLKLKIKSAKPDGLIFQGDIIAVIPGTDNEIAVYDDRAVREPRFMDGDTVTVYARASGLAKMQIKSGNGIFAKVIDEYEVPSIDVIYTDKDNIESLGNSEN